MTTLGENITMKSYGIVHKMYDWYCDHIVEIAMVILIVGGVAGAIAISMKVGSLGCWG